MRRQSHPLQNFFCRRDSRRMANYRATKSARAARVPATAGGKSQKYNALKTLISSAFSRYAKFFA